MSCSLAFILIIQPFFRIFPPPPGTGIDRRRFIRYNIMVLYHRTALLTVGASKYAPVAQLDRASAS